jgi:hypothetical protein
MRPSILVAACLALAACRIEKVRSGDTARGGVEPGPGIASCGISPESRVSEDGLGLMRIGVSVDAIRAGCTLVAEQLGDSASGTAAVDLGRDTARLEITRGTIRRITLTHQAYRTSDSLGVGTHISTLLKMRESAALVDHNRLYAVSPAYCGLRFLLADPAPTSAAARSGHQALRRLPGETRTRELEIVGCRRRR